MGANMELEFDKYCKVGPSHRTVLPALYPQGKRVNKRRTKKSCPEDVDYDLRCLEECGFTEIKFRNYRSVSCKSLLRGEVELEHDKVLRRGSVYQTSRERKSWRTETGGGRKKIEFSLGSETSFSFSILDSICGSDEEAEVEPVEQERSSVMSLDLKGRQISCGKSAETDLMENQKFRCDQVSGPCNTGNALKERDAFVMNKSLSAKLILPQSPTQSDGNSPNRSSKSHFTPIKKMLNPLTKSKSHRSLSNASKPSGLASSWRTKTPGNPMLHRFSSAALNVDSATQLVKNDQQPAPAPCLSNQINGNLKMEQKHGVSYFQFSVAQSNDVFVAKTWKEEHALNWVYTFHSVQGKKRSNATSEGVKYSNKDAPIVGQMQVSCYLCSEQKDGGGFGDSMVAEFVLYDIAHARKSATAEEKSCCHEDSKVSSNSIEGIEAGDVELDYLFNPANPRMPTASSVDFSTPYPWPPLHLHPSLEVAAVVVEVPFENRGNLKYKKIDRLSHQVHSNLLGLSSVAQGTRTLLDNHSLLKLNVVTPVRNHGPPIGVESQGPAPLLKRWRLGEGCECGGWDMGCPLVVFGNHDTRSMEEHLPLEKDQPLTLYIQGGKQNMPALTITTKGKGQYSVDFHAQLSTLQAFAVCVAILHTTEASSSVDYRKKERVLECNSLKGLVEDKVKVLTKAVTQEEMRKVIKMAQENPPSSVINPPFSPIARV